MTTVPGSASTGRVVLSCYSDLYLRRIRRSGFGGRIPLPLVTYDLSSGAALHVRTRTRRDRVLRRQPVLLVLVLIALSPAPAGAQSGRIVGRVADATGAVLPGVAVTLFGGPDEPRVSVTDGAGRFVFAGLPPGAYRLIAGLSGFETAAVDGIVVATGPVKVPLITLPLAGLSDTLVVTATRTEEPLRDVPMSISAFSGADIERRDLEDAAELAQWTPGLTVVDQGARGRDVLIVRGLHTDSLNGSGAGDTGVATYLGDVPIDVDLRLGDIERVEVLLGPQGTLYGAGTLAGAVRYLPRRPDTERRTFDLRTDVFGLAHGGSAGSDVGLTFNLPLVRRRLALRGSIDRFADPGFIDYDYLLVEPGVSEPEPDLTDPRAVAANLRQQPDANTEETISTRLSVLWETSPKLSALLSYHLQDRRAGARQINHAASFGTGRYVSAHRFLEPLDRRPEGPAREPRAALGSRCRIAHVRDRLLVGLDLGVERSDRPADPGVRHRAAAAERLSGTRAGAGARPARDGHGPDVTVPYVRGLHAG